MARRGRNAEPSWWMSERWELVDWQRTTAKGSVTRNPPGRAEGGEGKPVAQRKYNSGKIDF